MVSTWLLAVEIRLYGFGKVMRMILNVRQYVPAIHRMSSLLNGTHLETYLSLPLMMILLRAGNTEKKLTTGCAHIQWTAMNPLSGVKISIIVEL